MPRFMIISTGVYNQEYMDRAAASVDAQTHKDWQYIQVIDDAASWPERGVFFHPAGPRTTKIIREHCGALKNFVDVMTDAVLKPGDIVVRLDLDDQITPNALEIVAKAYQDNPKAVLTYGSMQYESRKPARFQGSYKEEPIRFAGWKSPHLLTFRAELWKHIRKDAFVGCDGQYYQSAADLAIFWPLAELAGLDRIVHIEEPIYIYNDLNDLNDHKLNPELQKKCERQIRRKSPHRRIKDVS